MTKSCMTFNMFSFSMKRIIISALCLLTVFAVQSQNKLPDFNTIRTPNSPAFTILGIQPTSIERPNTPADLALSVDNATGGFTQFPQNYSIEFAPYWMSKKPRSVTWWQDTTRTIEQSLERTFSISFATTNREVGEKEIRGLSYGLRTFIFSGTTSRESVKKIKKLEADLTAYSKKYSELDQDLTVELQRRMAAAGALPDATAQQAARQDALTWFNAEKAKLAEQRKEEASDDIQPVVPQRHGLILEVAYAGAYSNDTTNTDLRKNGYAFWATPAYVLDKFSFVGVYRYQKDSADMKSQEYGFRVIHTKERYAFSVEYLKGKYESDTPLPNRERLSILVEYLVSKDLWINLSFGDDNKNIGGKNTLFSTLGLKYNFSSKRYSF
jgi:hypothetical protein